MRTLRGLVWSLLAAFLPLILSIAPNIQCLALSDKFYNNYLEAQSFLRGGVRTRALRDLNQLEHHSHAPQCSMTYIKQKKYILCNINYGPSEDVSTMAPIPAKEFGIMELKGAAVDLEMATITLQMEVSTAVLPNVNAQLPTVLSVVSSTIVTDLATDELWNHHHHHHHHTADHEAPKPGCRFGFRGGEFFNRLEYSSTAHATPTRMTGLVRGESIKFEMNFEQGASADSVSASASLYLSYDPMWDTIAITGSHTASIGVWTTSTTYDVVNVSPFPSDPGAEFIPWVGGGLEVAVSKLSEVFCGAEELAPRTEFLPTLTETSPASSPSTQNFTLQGSFFGVVMYNSATATWNGRWGPYDSVASTLPFNATAIGADDSYKRSISEDWSVSRPFSDGREAEHVKQDAEFGPVNMVSQVGQWNAYRLKNSNARRRSKPLTTEIRAPIHINAARSTDTSLTARNAATIIVPAVTEVVTQTKTVTNTHIPLFGRIAQSKGTSAERRTDQGSRFMLWLPWVICFWLLVFICSFSLVWHRISSFTERQWRRIVRFFRPDLEPTDSSFWNILPTMRRPTARKVSGSEVIDPARLESTRHRGSKESFQSVELDRLMDY
ncbi:hypothetical protein TWF506_007142 [Arthrobotrys conoides]|uniref:Uncharacterized protein n=1 Tax=Arthrobotrys conoides TaxID=74498 RepID=A0AAN8NF95_9PEZI